MVERLVVLIVALGVLSLGFGLLEWRWPSVRGQKRIRSGFFTDVTWWMFTPTAGKLFTGIFVAVVIIVLVRILGAGITVDHLRGLSVRETMISGWPIGLQLIVFLVLADFLSYWAHRAHHTWSRLWRTHAVHHSSTELDWLSSVRVHPLNDALQTTAIAAPLLLLGFSPATLGAYLPFLTLYAIALHANVSWGYGPLRFVISSPAFHRWHHSMEPDALDKNFAGLFPAFDWLFGTLYLPKDRRASQFGVADNSVSPGFVGQVLLRRNKASEIEAPAASVSPEAILVAN